MNSPLTVGTTRRQWLGQLLAVAGARGGLWAAAVDEVDVPFADDHEFVGKAQPANPRVRNFDLRRMAGRMTPVEEFFVFHQSTTPVIDVKSWRLVVGGLVDRPSTFSLVELLAAGLTPIDSEVTIECAGNTPRKDTMNGQVSNARWSGVAVADLLRRCGLRSDAREVVFFGADQARDAAGNTSGPHGRSVFVQDVLSASALLATHMNGEPLTPDHGYPLRLILPGWYGMAQIKWLSRIEVLDRRYEGLHMSRNYHTLHAVPQEQGAPLFLATSIARTRLKSVVARVIRGRDRGYRITGAAWGGSVRIEKIEVQIDQGAWQSAAIVSRGGPYAWLQWTCPWPDATPGSHMITSRAIDAAGQTQPTAAEWAQQIRTGRENNAQWERRIELPA